MSNLVMSQYRGIYINQFESILQDDEQMNELVSWLTQHEITHVSLYDLHKIFPDETLRFKLDSAIAKLKGDSREVIAVFGGSSTFVEYYIDYQDEKKSPFDGVNMEYEWWVGKDHFELFREEVDPLVNHGESLETYIGWFSKGIRKRKNQAAELVSISDVITVHVYQKDPGASYVKDRLKAINQAASELNKPIDVVFIYSMEARFSGPLSVRLTYDEIHQQVVEDLNWSKLPYIRMKGWKVFCYTDAIKYRPMTKSDK